MANKIRRQYEELVARASDATNMIENENWAIDVSAMAARSLTKKSNHHILWAPFNWASSTPWVTKMRFPKHLHEINSHSNSILFLCRLAAWHRSRNVICSWWTFGNWKPYRFHQKVRRWRRPITLASFGSKSMHRLRFDTSEICSASNQTIFW